VTAQLSSLALPPFTPDLLLPCLESTATWFLSISDDSGTELIDETRRGLLPINAACRNADARMCSSGLFTVEHLRQTARSRLLPKMVFE
jgi:hypothetical protein